MLLAKGFTDALQLALHILARQFEGLQLHLIKRNGRSICPYSSEHVEVRLQRQATLFAQVANQLFYGIDRCRHTVDTYRLVCHIRQLFAQPLSDGRRTFHLQFHQLEFRTLQLLGSSNKVARVSPQGCTRQCDDGRTCRPVEAAYPFPTLPVVSGIFALVWVGRGENVCRQVFPAQFLAQQCQAFCYLFLFHDGKITKIIRNSTFLIHIFFVTLATPNLLSTRK